MTIQLSLGGLEIVRFLSIAPIVVWLYFLGGQNPSAAASHPIYQWIIAAIQSDGLLIPNYKLWLEIPYWQAYENPVL